MTQTGTQPQMMLIGWLKAVSMGVSATTPTLQC